MRFDISFDKAAIIYSCVYESVIHGIVSSQLSAAPLGLVIGPDSFSANEVPKLALMRWPHLSSRLPRRDSIPAAWKLSIVSPVFQFRTPTPVKCKTGQVPSGLPIMLQAQSWRESDLSQACHEVGEKSSEIVPLGAPLPTGSTVRLLSEKAIQTGTKRSKANGRIPLVLLHFVVRVCTASRPKLRYEPEGREFESPRAHHSLNLNDLIRVNFHRDRLAW